jgi:uncharacterized protein
MQAPWLAAVLGGLIGLILALTGAGGGVLAIPLLVLVMGVPVHEAGPVGLAAVGVAALIGAVAGLRQGIVRYRAAALIGSMGMLAAPLGVWLAPLAPQRLLVLAFASLLAWVAWRILRDAYGFAVAPGANASPACKVQPAEGRLIWTSPCARALAATGAFSGLLSGMLGVGGGFVIVPALMQHSDLDARSIQATSLAVIAMVSLSGVLTAATNGQMNAPLAMPFVGGAIVAMLAGQRVAARLDAHKLKQAFAWLSLLVAALMVWQTTRG